MNLQQINEIRANAGLPALETNTEKKLAQKRRQDRNRSARAEENRRIRAVRNGTKK